MVAESLKIPKNAKKVDFSRGRFFDDFLDGQKIEKRKTPIIGKVSSPGLGSTGGTIGGATNQCICHFMLLALFRCGCRTHGEQEFPPQVSAFSEL